MVSSTTRFCNSCDLFSADFVEESIVESTELWRSLAIAIIVGVCFSVGSQGAIPPGVALPKGFGKMELMGRADLLTNAVTVAVMDG